MELRLKGWSTVTAYSASMFMADGHRIHRVLGRESDGVTRTQAEQFIEKIRSEAREGRLSLPRGRKTHFSFSEAAKKYLDRLEETNGKNLVAKRRQLRLYLDSVLWKSATGIHFHLHGGSLQTTQTGSRCK